MKKLIIIFTVLFLAGCGYKTESSKTYNQGEINLTVYVIDNKPLECIAHGNRLSCNWDKYNNEQGLK